jgi:GTP-binding protein EngB required for normal cell division
MSIGIIVFGEVGTGKSTLCNTLINQTNAFKESDDVDAETLETIAKDGSYKGQKVHVIDTPGMGHSNSLDASHLVEIARHLKTDNNIQAIVMTFNFHCPRFEERERMLLNIIRNAFPNSEWFKHIAFVHTKVFGDPQKKTPETIKKRKEGWNKKMKLFFPEIKDEYLKYIPQFFIDSYEARENSNDSTCQICELLAWASGLKSLKEDLPGMSVPLGKPEKESRKRKGPAESIRIWHKGQKIFGIGRDAYTEVIEQEAIITEERTIQKMTDGSIKLIEDWHEIHRNIIQKK